MSSLLGIARRLRLPAAAAVAGGAGTALYVRGAEAEYLAVSESTLPKSYDPAALHAVWSQHPRVALARVCRIAALGSPWVARCAADHAAKSLGRPADEVRSRQAERARELRVLLTALGPTFIKFGQMLSIRPDVIPPAAVYELQKLCDAVPSYPTAEALALIEAELGRPAAELFDGLDASSTPIAAASLAGVPLPAARERRGDRAQGPAARHDPIGLARPLAAPRVRHTARHAAAAKLSTARRSAHRSHASPLPLRYMRLVELFKENILTGVFGAADRSAFDVKLLDTFARASYLELDYEHELANAERMTAQLLPRLKGRVRVPRTHAAASSRKVLAAEWIDGEQLARSPPEVIRRLVPVGVECFLAQLLDVGFFHGDPHPGNLLVDGDGRLVLIDFGLCAEIDKFDSRALTATMVHLMRGDVPALIDDAVTLRFLPPDVDRAALLPPLSKIFEQGKLAVASEIAAKRNGAAVAQRRAQFGAVSRELNQIFFDFPFAVPEYFALITRALIVLEGIALSGDKDFDLFNAAYPYAQKHARELFGAKQLASMLGEAVTSDVGALLRPAAEPAAPPRRGSRMVSRVTGRLMVPSPPVT